MLGFPAHGFLANIIHSDPRLETQQLLHNASVGEILRYTIVFKKWTYIKNSNKNFPQHLNKTFGDRFLKVSFQAGLLMRLS